MYRHVVQYYETDKMGIVHHSNYIRFMEEARVDFFKSIGFDYREFEKMGIVSPVVGLNNIRFRKPSTYGDEILIEVSVKSFNAWVLTLGYAMRLGEDVIFTGESSHCFLSSEGNMIAITEAKFPELHKKLMDLIAE